MNKKPSPLTFFLETNGTGGFSEEDIDTEIEMDEVSRLLLYVDSSNRTDIFLSAAFHIELADHIRVTDFNPQSAKQQWIRSLERNSCRL